MKQIVIMLVLSISISSAFAQVPDKVKMKFKENHPEMANAQWTALGDNEYAVTYTDSRHVDYYTVYDEDGDILSTEMVTVEYPEPIKTYYVKTYPDEKDYHVWIATDVNGDRTYYVREHGYRLWFDKAGNFVKKESEKMKHEYKKAKKEIKEEYKEKKEDMKD